MKTVHMIGNAHLDPVWLWSKIDGIDAVLATARSACDRLDEYPEFIFTSSTSWFHKQIELMDSWLFERIKVFVESGRWQLVSPSVVEPDCNLPSEESFRKQFEFGQRYFKEKFGAVSTVGYNIDSFGHCAYLPRFMAEAGIDSYVFMRPAANEKQLPANLFRWQSPDGHEVKAFRISDGYLTLEEAADISGHIEKSLENMPNGVEHTMCFFGVGDHGGGPTKAQIEWILENRNAIDGVQLIISHPRAFFDAIAGDMDKLPVVKGELQYHAIGCYSVERRIKAAMRKAEAEVIRAENVKDLLGEFVPEDFEVKLAQAWQQVLFNQFHDIAGGTCLAKDNLLASSLINAAKAQAEFLTTVVTRRAFRSQTEPGVHKIVILNPAKNDFEGYLEHEPWLQFRGQTKIELFDEQGGNVCFQEIACDGFVGGLRRLLFNVKVDAESYRILKLVETKNVTISTEKANIEKQPAVLFENDKVSANLSHGAVVVNGWRLGLEIIDDPTDTWTHNKDRFDGKKLGSFDFKSAETVETGPIRKALKLSSEFDRSRIFCTASIIDGESALRLKLSVVWAQTRQLLKLTMKAPSKIVNRSDMVSGGVINRAIDGREYPIAGGVAVECLDSQLAVFCPDVFSGSIDDSKIAFTLLRSPFSAHHDPIDFAERPDQPVCDQGNANFDLILHFDKSIEDLTELGAKVGLGPMVWDLTG